MTLDTTTGGASADSYATLAEYQAYASALGWTLSGVDATDEAYLRRAAQFVDRGYSFLGYPTGAAQARAWPRSGVGYVDGWDVGSSDIPQAVKDAQCELAYLIQGGLDPFATIAGVVASTRYKAGPVETETTYHGGKGKPRLVAIEGLLRPYLGAGLNSVRVVRS